MTCGREGNTSTPQPKSQDKDALPPDLSRTSRDSVPLGLRMGYYFASLIVRTADTSRTCARQASRAGGPETVYGTGVRVSGLDAPDPCGSRAQ